MKKLFAGFWIGEFGWELMTWIPHVRAIAKNYDYVIVGCKPGHEPLYEFADEFVTFDYSGAKAEQWMNEPYRVESDKKGAAIVRANHNFKKPNNDESHWIDPAREYSYSMKTHAQWLTGLQPQEFKKYGDLQYPKYDIILNVRNRTVHDSSFRNWDVQHAEEFVARFPDKIIACIGTKEQSMPIPNTENYLGFPQDRVNGLLSNAKVFVSSINGATHLASLCGCPQVAWVTKPDHKERLEKTWNPFNTPTRIFLSPDGYWKNRTQWHPPVDALVKVVKELL